MRKKLVGRDCGRSHLHVGRWGCGSGMTIWASPTRLWVGNDDLSFIGGQSLSPSAWVSDESESEENKNF